MAKNTKYISPKGIYARIMEEMRSYFSSGGIDPLLFEIWTKDCIDKFENTYRPIEESVLDMYNHKCELPCNFHAVKEVWMTVTYDKGPVQSPHAFYYQTDCRISSQADNVCSECTPGYQCMTHAQQAVNLPSLCDVPDEYIVTHKVTSQVMFRFQVTVMLKPGNFRTIGKCGENCPNVDVWCEDTFDIIGNYLHTSFSRGTIYLAYYADYAEVKEDEGPDAGYYKIPDNDPFQKYLYHYLRFMIYQVLFDQSTDETFKQMQLKRADAEQKLSDAYITARTYAMSPDIYDIEKSIVRSYNKHNRYLIPGPATRSNRH